MVFVLDKFSLHDMEACSEAVRKLGADAHDVEGVAERLVRFFYEQLVDSEGQPAMALVRLYKTRPLGKLDLDLKQLVESEMTSRDDTTRLFPSTPCLSLKASVGLLDEWNNPNNSRLYRAVPVISREFVSRFPLISQLFAQLGMDVGVTECGGDAVVAYPAIARDHALFIGERHSKCCVFWAPDAAAESLRLKQDEFVVPYGIKSVLGLGGILKHGVVFVTIMFSRVKIDSEIAARFQPVALSSKNALLDVLKTSVAFDEDARVAETAQ